MIQFSTDETKAGQPESIRIKIDAHSRGNKVAPYLSEIGVLITAINRSINDMAALAIYESKYNEHQIERQFREPNLVETELRGVWNGSIIIDATVIASDFISTNKAGVIQGLIATAIWTTSGKISRHFSRAADRLGGSLIFDKTSETPKRVEPRFIDSNIAAATENATQKTSFGDEEIVRQHTLRNPKTRTITVTITIEETTHIAVIACNPDQRRGEGAYY